MSLELKQAKLGRLSPYPTPMQLLNAALTHLDGCNGVMLNETCKPLKFYKGQARPTTDDGYSWFWSQNFSTPFGLVRVCIPWSQDWARKDGSQMDRSAAVYADTRVPDAHVFDVVLRLTAALAARLAEQLRRKVEMIAKQAYLPISPGTPVRTTAPNMALRKEWTDEGWASKKWGVTGEVIAHHDSHGLCYDVRHDDGTQGSYDPSELEVLT